MGRDTHSTELEPIFALGVYNGRDPPICASPRSAREKPGRFFDSETKQGWIDGVVLLAEPSQNTEVPTGSDLTSDLPVRDSRLRDAEPMSHGGITAQGLDQLVNGADIVHNATPITLRYLWQDHGWKVEIPLWIVHTPTHDRSSGHG
jgi:hypothetical protein